MARVSGFLRDSSMARAASGEPIIRRFWHRVPWLLLGLLGALLAADIVGFFERQIQAKVMLAFFIPGIVYLADAVGTQTEALVIRGLSVGVPIGNVLRREIITGLVVGLTLAVVFFPIGWWRWVEVDLWRQFHFRSSLRVRPPMSWRWCCPGCCIAQESIPLSAAALLRRLFRTCCRLRFISRLRRRL
jgi:hypothetical protein